ncbi:hypothetical protein [Actinomadura parmotrematis]|uniref:DUF3040 domain-containing protein n=1 Tax=Actinomadura parmotrematis TaxID=2864039 RepID=A0ABS7FZM7_9ACTN|nr:hypothetical protein [Actinomadura parmotrematis]MBW8485901.1 hypothetical protein [Actinomadura parmotrematis]
MVKMMEPPRRLLLLVGLAARLTERQRTCAIAIPHIGGPVLYVYRLDGRRLSVLAMPQNARWWFMWGRYRSSPAEELEATARILAEETAG